MFHVRLGMIFILIIMASVEAALPFNEDAAKRVFFTDSGADRARYMNDPFPDDHLDGITYCVQAVALLDKYDFLDEDAYSSMPPKDRVFGYKIDGILHHVSVYESVLKVCHFSRDRTILISYNHKPEMPGYFYYKYNPDQPPVKKGIYAVHLWNYLQADLLYKQYGKFKKNKEKPDLDLRQLKNYVENKYVRRLEQMENSLKALRENDLSDDPDKKKIFEEKKKYLRLYKIMVAEIEVLSKHLYPLDRVKIVPERIQLFIMEDKNGRDLKESIPISSSSKTSDDEKSGNERGEESVSKSESDSDPNIGKSNIPLSRSKSTIASSEPKSRSKSKKSASVDNRPSPNSKDRRVEISNAASKSKVIPVEIDTRSTMSKALTTEQMPAFKRQSSPRNSTSAGPRLVRSLNPPQNSTSISPPFPSPNSRSISPKASKKSSDPSQKKVFRDRELKSWSELGQMRVESESQRSAAAKRPAEDNSGVSKIPRSNSPYL